jgi:ribosomal RNA-processing protein 1
MRREWFGIDRLRLDKYLMLIRKFIAQMFRLLSGSKW